MTRTEVYKLIDATRNAQDTKWAYWSTKGRRDSWEAWYFHIGSYMDEAKRQLANYPPETANQLAEELMLKVAASAVAALEQLKTTPSAPVESVPTLNTQ